MMNENHENPIPEENHCEHEAGMTAASQENRSANAQAETKEQESYAHVHVQPEPDPVLKELAKQRKSMKRTMVTGFLCCGLLAGGIGFGGGLLANQMNNSSTTLYRSTGSKVEVQPVAAGSEMSVEQVAALNQQSVVEIKTEKVTNSSFLQQYVQTGAGSGVIISEDGYLITNNHVIDGASTIQVRTSDGTTYDAVLVGTDSKTDVAVLKINASGLTPVTFGDSDNLNVGETAVAIGNPLGELGGTVTNGIISAKDRSITLDNQQMTLLQTNAAINPGNSGGGLFNSRGELIGMVVAKSSGSDVEGLGFAIPSNLVSKIAQELIANGYVTGRPAMGVTVLSIENAQTAMQYGVNSLGVYITDVESGSSAEKAGLQAGDRIISLNNQVVETFADLSAALDNYSVGDTVDIMVSRNGSTVTVSLTLQEKKNTTVPQNQNGETQSNPEVPLN
ncbi:S1C family serine protease [Holdemania massiliensis]|uniref:S1C family serine protease n=1 Tax=Holdemania massiliensis TaxID=1468449 RepID=UPI001F06FF0F|nr:trypsin-like peptidase domain-containing protein [Holdemania massiliensis]MCH1940650.1 trypsin-like peptidase domain-containing protein [Holdemania massiliensis]